MMKLEHLQHISRRHFLMESAAGLGAVALGGFMGGCNKTQMQHAKEVVDAMAPKPPHFPAKAKRVIYLHMAGAPSQLELFDFKPDLMKMDGQDCPPSLMASIDALRRSRLMPSGLLMKSTGSPSLRHCTPW